MESVSAPSAPPAPRSWLDQPVVARLAVNAETILFVTILALTIFSRFYLLGARVMSHDENTHVYYSWRLFRGQGFTHDPLMHGPFLFHVTALSYFLFGDNDFTGRLPQALFSIATVAFLWAFRRYLGRAGTLVAAGLMLISPFILYYGRYARNEAFVGLFGVITLWAILRYLETGLPRYTYYLTAATLLHLASKETGFIYTAQALMFLAIYLVYRLARLHWESSQKRGYFLAALIAAVLLLGASGATLLLNRSSAELNPAQTAAPSVPGQLPAAAVDNTPAALPVVLGVLGGLALLAGAYYLVRGYGWKRLREERAFGLLVLLGTLVLPQLAAFPLRFLRWTLPTNAPQVAALTPTGLFHIAIIVVPFLLISVGVGLLWNPRLWLLNAAIFYSLFVVLFTTVFTNGAGVITGLIGGLGYWLEQQGVNRGSQPWYYYALVQVPVYEYLPTLGSLLALVLYTLGRPLEQAYGRTLQSERPEPSPTVAGEGPEAGFERAPVLALLGFWSITSLVAYSVAGEKMPWLTFHITLPMILLSGLTIGYLIDRVNWGFVSERRGWLVAVLVPVFLLGLTATFASLLGLHPPFQGKELAQLQATNAFLLTLLVTVGSGAGLFSLSRAWPVAQAFDLLALGVFAGLALLTARTGIRASFVTYDYANELLVYAHGAPGVKEALAQIEEISRRTTDGLGIIVGYDNETSYPYLWYLRDYPNARFFGENPTRSLREAAAILVGDTNYGKIEAVVGQNYYPFEYIRLWWPNQDYYALTPERIKTAITDRQMRSAIFQIWLNRDYSEFGQATGRDLGFPKWNPAARMRLYVRKDIAGQMWNYGTAPTAAQVQADPYDGKGVSLTADRIIGSPGSQPGQLNRPGDLAVAQDGSIYVVDVDNHRVQHLNADGAVMHVWGSFADISSGNAPGGTFNQPWGIAVGPDGSVYVADTWNYRIQKFTADGQFLKMWGYFGQAEKPDGFWGPRDVLVDSANRVFVTDTGNKRIVVFDSDGNFISQFGQTGLGPGEFDEPVGLAMDAQGQLYVADTWNQRIQVFGETDGQFNPVNEWNVAAWYGESLYNKPYLAADAKGDLFASDPEGYRVLQFKTDGSFVRYWGDFGTGPANFGLAAAVAVDPQGGVWVSDSGNNRLMHFSVPAP